MKTNRDDSVKLKLILDLFLLIESLLSGNKEKQATSTGQLVNIIRTLYRTYVHHITHVVPSSLPKLYQINRFKKSFNKEILKLPIALLVFSKILYCSTLWSNISAGNISELQSIQNFASKRVTNSNKFDHVTPLLRQLNWLPVKQLLLYKDAVITYKCLSDLAPRYLSDKFIKRFSMHARYTRKGDSLQIPIDL